MPRDLVLGNGKLLINLDGSLAVRDLYYPHVGMLNHVSGWHNSIGVWKDGHFSWLDDPAWTKRVAYEDETLVGKSTASHAGFALELCLTDAVHAKDDLFVRRIDVRNRSESACEVRLFFTHDFSINQTDIGDTALYDPSIDAVLHYKRDKCILTAARSSGAGLYQYATGIKRFGGAEGTWRDAEDGWLEGNPIAQGSVDSTFSVRLQLPPGERRTVRYWVVVAESFEGVRRLHDRVERVGVDELVTHTRAYWRAWVRRAHAADLPEEVERLYKRSLLVIRTQIDRGGAVLAANDTDILRFNRDHYSYMWPRDGALVAYALDEAGYPELTRPFYEFCARNLSPGGFLWHKYNPDGSVGSSWHPWVWHGETQLPIQEDETALVLFALERHYRRTSDLEFVASLFDTLVGPAADFLTGYRDRQTNLPLESYDLWEERRGVFTFTTAAVCAALEASARLASLLGRREQAHRYEQAAVEVRSGLVETLYDRTRGRFLRGVYIEADGTRVEDDTLESSLFGLQFLGVLEADDPRLVRTLAAVEQGLWVRTDIGGVARYQGDAYFFRGEDFRHIPGNPWVICTLWLAQWRIARARTRAELERSVELLRWVCRHSRPSGVLSEQVHPHTGESLSVAPLTWSHSTFVLTVIQYLARKRRLEERAQYAARWHTSE